ncbi:MAG: hypothetical protein JWM59_241 [Verrucomicrobiales bacterium]|nr:hypothetical protein [Verrucomicrobiales bacterium]
MKSKLSHSFAATPALFAATAWQNDPAVRLLFNNSPAAFNSTLTTYAQGYSTDIAAQSTASFIAPWVVTGRASGQFKRYDEKSSFAVYKTDRGIGEGRQRIVFGADDPFFNCRPHGLEIPTDDFEKEQAGVTGDRFPLMQAKIRTLVAAAYRSREFNVWAKIKAAKAATGGIGVWSNAANDPIKEINGEIQGIANDTGMLPNRMVMSLSAWATVLDHAKVLSRRSGVSQDGVTYSDFARMLLNPQIQIKVGMIPYDTAARGLAVSKSNIIGAEVFIFHAQDQPDTLDPSFAKSFSTFGRGVDEVKTYREKELMEIAAVDWSEDVQVVSPLAGRRITVG